MDKILIDLEFVPQNKGQQLMVHESNSVHHLFLQFSIIQACAIKKKSFVYFQCCFFGKGVEWSNNNTDCVVHKAYDMYYPAISRKSGLILALEGKQTMKKNMYRYEEYYEEVQSALEVPQGMEMTFNQI